jgi:protein-disulfide isomerase
MMRATHTRPSVLAIVAGSLFLVAGILVACDAGADSGPAADPVDASSTGEMTAQDLDADRELIRRAHEARIVGSEDADVTLDEYVDFACPDCRAFTLRYADELEALVLEENVLYSVRFYPIPRLMRGYQAAEAALCAGAIGGREAFAAARSGIFEQMDVWRPKLDPRPVLEEIVGDVGIEMEAWRDCVERDAVAPLILSDVSAANRAGLTGTPSFFFNRAGAFEDYVMLDTGMGLQGFRETIRSVREGSLPAEDH